METVLWRIRCIVGRRWRQWSRWSSEFLYLRLNCCCFFVYYQIGTIALDNTMSTEKGCLFRAKAARLECCRHQGWKPVLVLLNVSRYYTGQSFSGRRCCWTQENLECHAKARFCYLCGTGWGRVLSWAEFRVWTSYAWVGLRTYAFRGSTVAVKHQKRRVSLAKSGLLFGC